MGLSLVIASFHTDLPFIKVLAWIIFVISMILAFVLRNVGNTFKSSKKRNNGLFIIVMLIFGTTIIFVSILSPGLNSYAKESISNTLNFMGFGVLLFSTIAWALTVRASE
jgi:hypothetical protein